jgi:hypothetical protein
MEAVITNNYLSHHSGGPKTDEGKSVSRQNAITHGYSAVELISSVLSPQRLDEFRRHFLEEWKPTTPTEVMLVEEITRHSAMLELMAPGELSVLLTGARAFAAMEQGASSADEDPSAAEDRVLTASLTSDAVERLTRYRRSHEKSLYQAIAQLREGRRENGLNHARVQIMPPPFNFTDDNCENYLIQRLFAPTYRCPKCGEGRGYWLATRLRWQCASCRGQFGIRAGTVMERSHLSLSFWFQGIWSVLTECESAAETLRTKSSVQRSATIREVLVQIRRAQESSSASTLLAGLDEIAKNDRKP